MLISYVLLNLNNFFGSEGSMILANVSLRLSYHVLWNVSADTHVYKCAHNIST